MTQGEPVAGGTDDSLPRRRVVAVVVTCAAIGAALVHVIWPALKVDSVTVVLFVVSVLPWLGDLFSSIELPGGTKLEYKQLAERVGAAEENTTRLGQQLSDTATTARVALAAGATHLGGTDDSAARARVESLSAEYANVRASMPHGSARTHRMEQLFAELMKATSQVGDLDVAAMLGSADPGTRLAAYARLYAVPDATRLEALVEAVLGEDLHFNQYWGFNTIGRVMDEESAARLPQGLVGRLHDCLDRLPADSDRATALQRVLEWSDLRRRS